MLVSPVPGMAKGMMATMEEVMTMRWIEGWERADESKVRVPWMMGWTMSFSMSLV